jgi:hypothetical protein
VNEMKNPSIIYNEVVQRITEAVINTTLRITRQLERAKQSRVLKALSDQRGDVPGWVLVVLMTTGLVTAIWTIAAPRLTAILRNSLDAMNGIR